MTSGQRTEGEEGLGVSKGATFETLRRYEQNPDIPMVHPRIAGKLESTQSMGIAPSKLYEDNGQRVDVTLALVERCKVASPPQTREDVLRELEGFFTFCGVNRYPLTLSAFAVWNGITIHRFDQLARDNTNRERAEAYALAKEFIRGFLEAATIDSAINPQVFFHLNKVYYGAVENQQVTVRVEDNSREISDDEQRERVSMLLQDSTVHMSQGEDGVFRVDE